MQRPRLQSLLFYHLEPTTDFPKLRSMLVTACLVQDETIPQARVTHRLIAFHSQDLFFRIVIALMRRSFVPNKQRCSLLIGDVKHSGTSGYALLFNHRVDKICKSVEHHLCFRYLALFIYFFSSNSNRTSTQTHPEQSIDRDMRTHRSTYVLCLCYFGATEWSSCKYTDPCTDSHCVPTTVMPVLMI